MNPEEPKLWGLAEVRPFFDRLVGAARLDAAVYDEIAADPEATNQAAVVIALSALAQALGGPERIAVAQLPLAIAWSYFSWLVPGTLVWLVASRLLGHRTELMRVLRCVGFASAPQLLWLVGMLPLDAIHLHLLLGVAIFMLALIANVVGIRQAFGVPTIRAALIFASGFVAFALLAIVLGSVFATVRGVGSG